MDSQYPGMRRAVRTLSSSFPDVGKEVLEEQAYLVSVKRRTLQEAVDCLSMQPSANSVGSSTRGDRKVPPRILCTNSIMSNAHSAHPHTITRRVSFVNLPPEDSRSARDDHAESNGKEDNVSSSGSSSDDDDDEEDSAMYNNVLSLHRMSDRTTSPSNAVTNRSKPAASPILSPSTNGTRKIKSIHNSDGNSGSDNSHTVASAAVSNTKQSVRARPSVETPTSNSSKSTDSAASSPPHKVSSFSTSDPAKKNAAHTPQQVSHGNANNILPPQRSILAPPTSSPEAATKKRKTTLTTSAVSATSASSASSAVAASSNASATSITAAPVSQPSSSTFTSALSHPVDSVAVKRSIAAASATATVCPRPSVHYMYGDNAENFDRDVIGDGGQVIVFTASMTGQRNTRDHFRSLENLLQAKKVPYHIMDVADNAFLQRTAREIYQRGTGVEGKGKPLPLPLLTVDRTLVGDYTTIQDLEDEGLFLEQLVKMGYQSTDTSVILPQTDEATTTTAGGHDASFLSETAHNDTYDDADMRSGHSQSSYDDGGVSAMTAHHSDYTAMDQQGASGVGEDLVHAYHHPHPESEVAGMYDGGGGDSDCFSSCNSVSDGEQMSWLRQNSASDTYNCADGSNAVYRNDNNNSVRAAHAPSSCSGANVTEDHTMTMNRLSYSQLHRALRNVNYTHNAENGSRNDAGMGGSGNSYISPSYGILANNGGSSSPPHPSKGGANSGEAGSFSTSSAAPKSILVRGSTGSSMRNINYQAMLDAGENGAYAEKATHRLSDAHNTADERGRRSSFVKFT